MNPLTAKIKPYVESLKEGCDKGDRKAIQVVNLYNMYVRMPESGSQGLCEAALDAWLKEQNT